MLQHTNIRKREWQKVRSMYWCREIFDHSFETLFILFSSLFRRFHWFLLRYSSKLSSQEKRVITTIHKHTNTHCFRSIECFFILNLLCSWWIFFLKWSHLLKTNRIQWNVFLFLPRSNIFIWKKRTLLVACFHKVMNIHNCCLSVEIAYVKSCVYVAEFHFFNQDVVYCVIEINRAHIQHRGVSFFAASLFFTSQHFF